MTTLAKAASQLLWELGPSRVRLVRADLPPEDQPANVRSDAERLFHLWKEELLVTLHHEDSTLSFFLKADRLHWKVFAKCGEAISDVVAFTNRGLAEQFLHSKIEEAKRLGWTRGA